MGKKRNERNRWMERVGEGKRKGGYFDEVAAVTFDQRK